VESAKAFACVYGRGVDALVGFLDGPRARGAFLLRSSLDPPWSLRIEDRAPLTVVAVVRGTAWVRPDDRPPLRLDAGDVALVRGPDPYTVADAPDTAPSVVIHPGQVCTTLDGRPLHDAMELGVRSWGNHPDGATVMVTGTYQSDGEISRRLVESLPAVVVLARDAWGSPLVDMLANEIVRDEPGQDAVLDRLLDLLLVAALRDWFARPDADAPRWYRAHRDPVAGHALRLLQNQPARDWTVATLAAEVGVSRAALARRFNEHVGEPPIAYLTRWRLTLAADLLREPDATVGSVARRVGYASPFTFSTAFKRHHGVSPQRHRAADAVTGANADLNVSPRSSAAARER
jgi:AraC-like DNA-binding protein